MNTEKKTLKQSILTFAEMTDALRIVPRVFLILYGCLVLSLFSWFVSIETTEVITCDSALIKILVDTGESIESAKQLACKVTDIIGGPTGNQTTFVTVIIGLATGVFGFYTSTGRKWGDKKESSSS